MAYRVFASLPGVASCDEYTEHVPKSRRAQNRRLIVQEFLQTAAQTSKDRVSSGKEDSRNLDSLCKESVERLNLPEPVVDHAKRTSSGKSF